MSKHEKTQKNTVERGNTKSLSTRSRKWCFTLNNYSETELKLILVRLETLKHIYIVGEEIGEQGTPHLQGYIEGKNAIKWDTLKKILPKAHIEPCKGSRKQNVIYCSKDNKFHTNINMNLYIDKKKYNLKIQFEDIKWKPFQENILKKIKTNNPDDRKINWRLGS